MKHLCWLQQSKYNKYFFYDVNSNIRFLLILNWTKEKKFLKTRHNFLIIVWPNRISDYCLKKRSSYIIRILQQTFWKQLRRNDLFSSKITIYRKNCRQLSILFHYIYIALTKFIFHSLCMNLKIYTSCNITLWMNTQKYVYTYVPKVCQFFPL